MNQTKPNKEIYTISVLTTNKPGVLVRISLIFASRTYNIHSLVVSPVLDGRFSRMTIVAEGHPENLDQVIKHLNKLVDIIDTHQPKKSDSIEVELALFKLKYNPEKHPSLLQIIQHFKGKLLDLTDDSIVIQVSGKSSKIDACEKMLQPYDLIEVVRTGKVLMSRKTQNLTALSS
ncbi:acetolactate synthase small subunit [PVC group bacterium (ex Bugula neritina AB1)]|nr:acetolactate synthase small subunit [PVC group bacterium (ex Bugula neritina AB1)]